MSGKLKIVGAGAVAVIVLVAALFLILRTTPKDIAGDFLSLIGQGEVEEAYGYLTPEQRARQNLDVFEHTVEELNLVSFASVNWDTVDDEQEGIVKFNGQVETKAGERIPLSLTLTQSADGSWLVAEFGKPGAARTTPEPTTPPAP